MKALTTIYEPKLILPDSIGDETIAAAMQALETQLKKLSEATRLTAHLPRLDELGGLILDILAWSFHVDAYDALTLSDEQKRSLIRESIAAHRRKGTSWAVRNVCKAFFDEVSVKELGGYLFRINAKGSLANQKVWDAFIKVLWEYKNVRSWLESITLDLSDEPTQLWAGFTEFIGGSVTIDPDNLRDDKILVRAGIAQFIGGSITIQCEPPFFPDETLNRLKLFFGFPISRHRRFRAVTVYNPRPDLTRAEIKSFGKFVADAGIVKNEAGEISNGIFAAALKSRSTVTIKEPPQKPRTLARDDRARAVLNELRDFCGGDSFSEVI